MRSKWTLTREMQIPKGAVKVADKQSDCVAYLYSNSDGKPCAVLFMGKADKPVWRYRFQTEERRAKSIQETFERRRERMASKQAERAKRKAWTPTYKVGDIFRTSWGYDQTNVEYFQIVEIRGKHAILREIGAESVDTGFMQGRCTPLPDNFLKPRYEGDDRGQPIRRLMQEHGIKICDVRTAWLVKPEMIAGVPVYESSGWSNYH